MPADELADAADGERLDRARLLAVLRREEFAPDGYYIQGVHQPRDHEGLGLRHQGPAKRRHWEIVHRERGTVTVLSQYATEDEACRAFLAEMRRYYSAEHRVGRREFAEGWIWADHLRTFLELLAQYAGYAFDHSDWETIDGGLLGTDDDRAGGWYQYPLAGREHVDVSVARNVDGDEVSIRLTGNVTGALRMRAQVLLDTLSSTRPPG